MRVPGPALRPQTIIRQEMGSKEVFGERELQDLYIINAHLLQFPLTVCLAESAKFPPPESLRLKS